MSPKTRSIASHLAVVGLVVGLVAGVAACGDDDGDSLESVATEVQEGVDDASARTVAEVFAAAVDTDEQAADVGARDLEVIDENAGDLPGDPEILYVEDADGDGADDDGRVAVRVGDQESCIELAADSGDASVLDGPC